MIETDLLQSYFASSFLGFRQFTGRWGDHGSRLFKKLRLVLSRWIRKDSIGDTVFALSMILRRGGCG